MLAQWKVSENLMHWGWLPMVSNVGWSFCVREGLQTNRKKVKNYTAALDTPGLWVQFYF